MLVMKGKAALTSGREGEREREPAILTLVQQRDKMALKCRLLSSRGKRHPSIH